jgi:hypothetical protein
MIQVMDFHLSLSANGGRDITEENPQRILDTDASPKAFTEKRDTILPQSSDINIMNLENQ